LPAVFTAKADEPKTVSAPIDWVEKQQEELPPGLVLDKEIRPSPQPQVAFEPGPDPTVTTQFDAAMVSGDKDIVESLQIWKDWAYRVAFTPVSDADIQAFGAQLTQALQEQGYVFAKVDFPRRVWPMGIFLAKVDCGPLGSVTVSGNKYYSASQIVANLGERQDEGRFNYARFYQDLYDLNAKPDVTVNTKLKPIIQDGRRVVNAELEVEDKLPIHGAIELSNSGTYHTNDWRIQTTLQHVNLTKHDDVLTVDWITSFDLSDVNAFSAGYFLPFNRDYSLNLFGGISDSDIDDVLPQMDIRGEGYFAGAQLVIASGRAAKAAGKTIKLKSVPRFVKYQMQICGIKI